MLGWAWTDRQTFAAFAAEAAAAPPSLRPALRWAQRYMLQCFQGLLPRLASQTSKPCPAPSACSTLCLLYGLSRIEAGVECYLSHGGGGCTGLGWLVGSPRTACSPPAPPPVPHPPATSRPVAGALSPEGMAHVHASVKALCRQLGAGNGRLALALCEGFGIPPHLLHAPIAVGDWRTFHG